MGRWETEDGDWVWRDNAYYDPLWDDTQAAEATDEYRARDGYTFRVYYDFITAEYKCRCSRYRDEGRCHHLTRYRHTLDVNVDDRYL